MEEKYEQVIALAPQATAVENIKNDEESATVQLQSNELKKKKKRVKCVIYIVAFAILQTLVIAGLALTVMKVKTPMVWFGSVTVQELTATGPTNRTAPLFKATFNSQLTVKNANFGPFEWEPETASFYYGAEAVGTASVPRGRVGARSSKRLGVMVNVDSSRIRDTARLGAEIGSGLLTLTSRAELSGEVRLVKLIKKKRNAKLDCTVSFDVSAKTVKDLNCK